MTAVVQALGVNLVVNRANVWLLGYKWAEVDFGSWSKNLELGWQWDETQFAVNMFVHPYHGSLYHAAARANCLTFWESIPIVFLGSWTWEYFGERFRPSLNDFWMTGYGGVALGEILYRISAAIIDERATGGERIAREIGALFVNPVGGLNRLVRGEWTRMGENPVDRIPEAYTFNVQAGARQAKEVHSPADAGVSPTLLMDATYGDVFETEYRAPFDVFELTMQVSPDGGGLNAAQAVGRLYGHEFTSPDSWHRHQIVVNQRFDYANNPVYRFGEQSLEVGLRSRWRPGPLGLRLNTTLAGDVIMLGAIDALDAGFGYRDIDYGPGVGALLELTLDRGGASYVTLYNRARYLRSVSGAPADHNIIFSGIEGSLPVTRDFAIGGYLGAARRRSYYEDLPKLERSYVETRILFTWTFARGVPGALR